MENVTKIDIMMNTIHCYDELTNKKVDYPLTSEYDFFMNTFSDTQDLLTVNITDPIARVMKFYTIENSIPKSYTELEYSKMTNDEKVAFNDFVEIIKTK
jgi:hypothetical protein